MNENTRYDTRPNKIVRLTDTGLLAAVWVGERKVGKRQIYFNLCRENRDPNGTPYVSLRPEHLLHDVVPGLSRLCGMLTRVTDLAADDRKQLAELALLLAQCNEMFSVGHGEGALVNANGTQENILDVS